MIRMTAVMCCMAVAQVAALAEVEQDPMQTTFSQIATRLQEDDYDAAMRLVMAAEADARRDGDPILLGVVRAFHDHTRRLRMAYPSIRASRQRLEVDPDDAHAALQVGRFYALTKGDWDAGVPYLARGADAGLRAAALADQQAQQDEQHAYAAGNGWWAAAVQRSPHQQTLRARAAQWYQLALPALDGAERDEVLARLAQAVVAEADRTVRPGVVKLHEALPWAQFRIAAGLRYSGISLPRRQLTGYYLDATVENTSPAGIVDDGLQMSGRILLRDGDGELNVIAYHRGLRINAHGRQDAALHSRSSNAAVKARNANRYEPLNWWVQVRLHGVVIHEAWLNPPGDAAWWLDDRLVR